MVKENNKEEAKITDDISHLKNISNPCTECLGTGFYLVKNKHETCYKCNGLGESNTFDNDDLLEIDNGFED